MTYPGGKNGSGVYQLIINQIPPHERYFELFAGGAAILRHKRPARSSIAADLDTAALTAIEAQQIPGCNVLQADALAILAAVAWRPEDVVYLDPPYLMETRASGRAIYAKEFHTALQHLHLLRAAQSIPARVILSGYPSALYDSMLPTWRTITYQAMTRGGRQATEKLWMNYPQPTELHDYRYTGQNYRERERIKKRTNRWKRRLTDMPATERNALLQALQELQAVHHASPGDADAEEDAMQCSG